MTPSSGWRGEAFPLATVALHSQQDVVALCRHVRLAGRQLGLMPRDIDRLVVALAQLARELTVSLPPTVVHLALAEGPSLEVRLDVIDAARPGGVASLNELANPLRCLVSRLEVTASAQGAVVLLGMLVRRTAPESEQDRWSPVPEELPPEAAASVGATEPGPADRNALERCHLELHDINRSVVALYAALDDQAEQLQLAEEKMRLLLDSVPDYSVCMLDAGGAITSWNAGGERLFGYSVDEIVGRPFAIFYPSTECEQGAPAAQLAAAESEGRLAIEGMRRRRDGDLFDAQVVLTPVRAAASAPRGFSLVMRDITERKRLEHDLQRRAEDLAAANRTKEDFLATLSHELRTPLNAMLGWTRLLRLGRLDQPGAAHALEIIERNAHVQAQLMSDILDASRIVAGNLPLDLRPLDLAPILETTLATLRPAAEAKEVALRLRAPFAGPVLGDPFRLQQAIRNLVANAIKFTPPGGSILVSLDLQGTDAAVSVTDTGEGVEPEVLPYVFDRFRQGDASVTRRHGGLGLGLTIARHIIEQHGGQLTVQSDGRDQGATFSMRIPIRGIRGAACAEAGESNALTGIRMLAVDDQPDARDVVSRA